MEYKIFTTIGMLNINVPMHERPTDSGERYMVCPICSSSRKPEHRKEEKLAVNIDGGNWRCNHCGEGGILHTDRDIVDKIKPLMSAPKTREMTDDILGWFKKRGISKETVECFRIKKAFKRILQIHNPKDELRGKHVDRNCIAFPFINDGKLINIQYRDQDKNFSMESGAEKILYNIDSIKPKGIKRAVITEGMLDCMCFHEAGFQHVVSVPHGATISPKEIEQFKKTGKLIIDKPLNLVYLDHHIKLLDSIEEWIIATDDDPAGIKLREEIARRLGRDKCRYIKFSMYKKANGLPCKDGNDILDDHGAKLLLSLVDTANYFPTSDIVPIDELFDGMRNNFGSLLVKGKPLGFKDLEAHISLHLGHSIAINGYATMGKTSFILYLLVFCAVAFKWKSICYTPENYPLEQVYELLIEIYIGKSAKYGSTDKMTITQYEEGAKFIKENIYLVADKEDGYTPKELLGVFAGAIKRYGIRICCLDPWNALEHKREHQYNLDDYTKSVLSKINRFTIKHNVLTLIGVHPPTPEKSASKTYVAPSVYEIEGGSSWSKKMYEIICIHRSSDDFEDTTTDVHIQKIKIHKTTGFPTPKDSPARLNFNRRSNRYEDIDGESPLEELLRDKSEQTELNF